MKNVWRIGTSWGNNQLLNLFYRYGIVFFQNESERIGDYKKVQVGDLLAICKFNSKDIVAIGIAEGNFQSLDEWPISYQKLLSEYDKPQSIVICSARIIKLSKDDGFKCTDYKRFYFMGEDKKTNDMWQKYYNDRITEIKNKGKLSLKELASKNNFIRIPAIQRGLVWKPKQVELLWDSILRGFPIGAFIFSESNFGFELLDGQQRFNAINLGYGEDQTDRAKLWIDLFPRLMEGSTRKFLIRVTTTSHPWGYGKDDDCSTLTAENRINAIQSFGYEEGTNMNSTIIPISQTWPYFSEYPIPLHIILNNLYNNDKTNFAAQCYNEIKGQKYSNSKYTEDDILSKLEKLYSIKDRIDDYTIPFSILKEDVINDESSNENQKSITGETNLEVLFRRITTGGTQISSAELSYSAIKVYWPELKIICEGIASKCMPPYLLANMAFRLYILINNKHWVKNLAITKIRELSNDVKEKKSIEKYFDSIGKIVNKVNTWLLGDNNDDYGVPSVIRTSIARNNPDVYLLLMWFASQETNLSGKYLTALAMFLSEFTDNNELVCSKIYEYCIKYCINNDIDKKNVILSAIDDTNMENDNIFWLQSPSDLKNMITPFSLPNSWTQNSIIYNKCYKLWSRIKRDPRRNPNLVLYAQRKYIKEVFKEYDPANEDMWESHNRPWDFDHILPHEWVYNKKTGEWRAFCSEWINVSGNFAAIPFELNRARSNKEDWRYYEENKDSLAFDENIKDCKRDNVRFDKRQANIFAKSTFERTIALYKPMYDLIQNNLFNDSKIIVGSYTARRRKLFNDIGYELNRYKVNYRYLSNMDADADIKQENDWSCPKIFLEIDIIQNECSIALENNNNENYGKLGLRIAPSMRQVNSNFLKNRQLSLENYTQNDEKWYLYKECELNIKTICDDIKELYDKILSHNK